MGFSIAADDLGILGRAAPSSVQLAGQGDGIVMIYDVLTGGGFPRWEEGHTLTHEIGTFLPWSGVWVCYLAALQSYSQSISLSSPIRPLVGSISHVSNLLGQLGG